MDFRTFKHYQNVISRQGVFALLDQAVLVLVGLFVFLNPFPHTTSAKELCFYLTLAILIFLIIRKKIVFSLRSPLTVPFVLYILWAGASIFWAIDTQNSMHDFYAHLVKYIVLYYVIINVFNSEKRLTILTWIVIISTFIFALKGMIHFYLLMGNPLAERLIPAERAPINSSAILNLFAAFLSLYFLTREKRWPGRILLSLSFAGTFMATLLSFSRAALIALVVSAGVLFVSHSGRKIRIIASIVILSLAAGSLYIFSPHLKRLQPEELSKDLRIGIYYTCVEIFKDYPIAGVGFGMETFEKHMWDKYNPKIPLELRMSDPASSPHGFFFDIMVRLGLVGLILFGFIILRTVQISRSILIRREKHIRRWGAYLLASFTGMLVAGFFGSILHGAAAYNFYILLAMITILSRSAQDA
ncbi:MAG TPA: O-antigen ligase family protein [Syntrophales bacterium]|nr:O-antigen ligase family protein [Syntrophales bacterium]